jgi:AcrR family transcriptional regulator
MGAVAGIADSRSTESQSDAPRTRTRRLGAKQRREQLVLTAQRLFGERGYRATTMEDIANAAGVTKPLLYQHFASKRALYLELVHQVSSELLDSLGAAHARSDGPREMMNNGLGAYFELIVTHEDAFRLLFGRQAPDDPELFLAVRKVETAVIDLIEAQMPTDLAPAHRRLLAYAIIGVAEAGTRYWVEKSRKDAAVAALDPTADAATDAEKAAAVADGVRLLSQRVAEIAWFGLRGVRPN